jgi:hypothetical protein
MANVCIKYDTGVAERTVANVIELFTDNYNKINPEFAIASDAVHLTDNRYIYQCNQL